MSEETRQIMPQMMEQDKNEEKRDMHGKVKIEVKKIAETDDSVTTEAKKMSATTDYRSGSPSSAWSSRSCQRGGSYETCFKQTKRSELVRFLV